MSRAGLRALDRHYATQTSEARARARMEAVMEPWRFTYHVAADRPGMRYVVSAATPRELVQQLRAHFATRALLIDTVRLFELPAPL